MGQGAGASPWRQKGWSGKGSERRDARCGPHRKTRDWPGAMGEGIPERKPSILPSLIANSRACTGAITAPSEERDTQPLVTLLGAPPPWGPSPMVSNVRPLEVLLGVYTPLCLITPSHRGGSVPWSSKDKPTFLSRLEATAHQRLQLPPYFTLNIPDCFSGLCPVVSCSYQFLNTFLNTCCPSCTSYSKWWLVPMEDAVAALNDQSCFNKQWATGTPSLLQSTLIIH